MRKILSFLCCLYCSLTFAAESSNDFWYGFFNESTINDKFSWWTETQLRHALDINQLQQTLVRTGPLLRINSYSQVGFLYAYVNTDQLKEHRLALQHTMTYGEYWHSVFSHRIRFEYRSFEGRRNLPERFRYFLRSQAVSDCVIKRVIWDEVFINLRKDAEIPTKTFSINRLFVGGRYSITPRFKLEAGYLNQFVNRPQRNLVEHIVAIYLFINS